MALKVRIEALESTTSMNCSKLIILATAAFCGCWTFGQTNTFPSSGNVGIGTTSPGAKLDVKGTVYSASTSSTDGYIALVPGGPGYAAYINWYKSGPTRLGYMGYQDLAGNPNNLALNLENSANFIIGGGNVGIGTAYPAFKLDIAGSGARITDNGGNAAQFDLVESNGGHDWAIVSWGSGAGGGTIPGRFSIYDNTVSAHRFLIDNNGNVGIGTTNPTQKLSVNGTVRAKEIIVDTNWSDFVFDQDYKLPTLQEVEHHIQQEKHLPGIPSAEEVHQHGISLGEMQARLIQKIEELTLHQIEQEKALKAVQAENLEMRRRIAAGGL